MGEPETRGEVKGDVGWGERDGCWAKRSSEKRSVNRVDLESVLGEVGETGEGSGSG